MTWIVPSPPSDRPASPLVSHPSEFSPGVTLLCAVILAVTVGLFVWLQHSSSALNHVSAPERALALVVGRTMDVEEALATEPEWRQRLYRVTSGERVAQVDQAIAWYRELAAVSPDPQVTLNLAVLLGEAGRLAQLTEVLDDWDQQDLSEPTFIYAVRAAYIEAPLSPADELSLQAALAEDLAAGWFYDRLASRLAMRVGHTALAVTTMAALTSRGHTILHRVELLTWAQLTLMGAGGLAVVFLWLRRRADPERLRIADAPLPPTWSGRDGVAVLLRGGAFGAMLTVGLSTLVDSENLWARAVVIPITNLPVLYLAARFLQPPAPGGLAQGLGLVLRSRTFGSLVIVVGALFSVAMVAEWGMGMVAESLKLSSHWTEWFDADLAWGSQAVVAVSLLEYVVYAPLFEETVFRGLLFGTLRRKWGWGIAASLSAGLFALAHGYGVLGFVSVFWSGLLWAWMYERSGSLLPGMLAHSLNNLAVCLSELLLLR